MSNILRGILGGVIAGAIGAAAWAAVAYFFNLEVSGLAIVVGILVGIGCKIGFRDDCNGFSGTLAASIALASIAAGKYIAVSIEVQNEIQVMKATNSFKISDEQIKAQLADQLADEYEQAGKSFTWPKGMSVENASTQSDYPSDLWADMLTRWNTLTPDEIEQRRAFLLQSFKDNLSEITRDVTRQGFLEAFSFYDIIWGFLAVAVSYRVAAGNHATAND